MTKKTVNYLIKKAKDLIAAPSVCPEAKAEGEKFLASVGTPAEADAAKALLKEMEEDITPIDGLIAFAGSDFAKEEMGEAQAAGLFAHAKDIKAKGAVYCDCPACVAAYAIIEKKDEILK